MKVSFIFVINFLILLLHFNASEVFADDLEPDRNVYVWSRNPSAAEPNERTVTVADVQKEMNALFDMCEDLTPLIREYQTYHPSALVTAGEMTMEANLERLKHLQVHLIDLSCETVKLMGYSTRQARITATLTKMS